MSKAHTYRCFCPSLFLLVITAIVGGLLPQSVNAEDFSSLSSETQKVFPTVNPTPELEHWHVGAYYDLERFPSAKLLLNNKDIVAREVRTTLYRMDGTPFEAPSIWVGANSAIKVDLAEWAALAGQGFTRGSLRIYHTGKDRVIGSQIFLEDNSKGISFEERLAELGKFNSKRMEGVWYMPRSQSDAFIAVSNTSDQIINVTARLSRDPKISGPLEQISLNPHQTRVFNVRNDFQNGSYFMSAKVVGIAITHTGGNSDLKVHGAVMDVPKGYSNVIQFSNPDTAKSSELHGVGLRLGQFNGEELLPIVVAKNVSGTTATITGKVNYTRTNGTTGTIQIGSANLKAGEHRSFNLQQVVNRARNEQIEIAGIEVSYNAAPGTFIVSAQSVGEGLDQAFRVPMYDPYAQVSSTGGYPFRIDGSSTTYAFVKNTTDVEKEYVTYLIWPDGGEYMIGLRTIAPGQTVQIDVRKLRDEQIADERGNLIPSNISEGQIRWTIRHEEFREDQPLKKFELVGRSEQVDSANKTSSSYACQNCCQKSSYGFITSSANEGEVGDQIQLTAFEGGYDCNGYSYYFQMNANSVNWSSSNSSTGTISNQGLVTITGAGPLQVGGTWFVNVTDDYGGWCPMLVDPDPPADSKKGGPNVPEPPPAMFEPDCDTCYTITVSIGDGKNIEAKPKVTITVPSTAADGDTVTFSSTVTGGTPTGYQWTFTAPSGSGNSPTVNFASPTAASTTATAHWFANPNRSCPTVVGGSDAAGLSSSYNVKASVNFSDRGPISKDKSFNVTVPATGGRVTAAPEFSGGPTVVFDSAASLWRVSSIGNFAFSPNNNKTLYVTNGSQFFAKVDAHEDVHMQQWSPTGLFGQHFQPSVYFSRISNFTDATQSGLVAKLQAEYVVFVNDAVAAKNAVCSQSELAAFSVSDLIAPFYVYDRCGRTVFQCN